MDVPFYVGLTALEFATLVGPDEPESAAAADEARAIWTRLGSPPLLARLDEGLARWAEGAETATGPSAVPVPRTTSGIQPGERVKPRAAG